MHPFNEQQVYRSLYNITRATDDNHLCTYIYFSRYSQENQYTELNSHLLSTQLTKVHSLTTYLPHINPPPSTHRAMKATSGHQEQTEHWIITCNYIAKLGAVCAAQTLCHSIAVFRLVTHSHLHRHNYRYMQSLHKMHTHTLAHAHRVTDIHVYQCYCHIHCACMHKCMHTPTQELYTHKSWVMAHIRRVQI